jgi:general secretion pathway protein N
MRPLRLLALGAIAYAAFLVATLPAAVVAPRLAAATGGQARLANVTGTVWNGSARLSITARGLALALDEVRWRFLPSRLAAGRVAFAVEARLGSLRGEAQASRTPLAWRVDELRASGDASALAAVLPLAASWQPAGTLSLEAPSMTWDGERVAGSATAEWRDAALALSSVRPLGSWRAQANAEGAAIKFSLATLKGPLRLSGNGTAPLAGRVAFSGEARAEPGREKDLESLLALLGPRRADGAHALELR